MTESIDERLKRKAKEIWAGKQGYVLWRLVAGINAQRDLTYGWETV